MISQFVYVSAWNDSGGGFLHRLFDGHPQIRCYPFEVQLGTGFDLDGFAEWFHPKYRWPTLPDNPTPEGLFDAIINDELWDSIGKSPSSKFKDFQIDLDVDGWRKSFIDQLEKPISTGSTVQTYLNTFFDAWRDRRSSKEEKLILGHCPILVLDWDRILRDDPLAKMINVVRSPFTGFIDMRRRHPNLDPALYGRKWALINTLAFVAARKDPKRFHIVTLDSIIKNRATIMRELTIWLGIDYHNSLLQPAWNGRSISQPGPFGGVPAVGQEHEVENLTMLQPETIDILSHTTSGARALFDFPIPE